MQREEGGAASADELVALRARLIQLRTAALDRYAEGELNDDQLMSCFLAHVNSSRDNLTRLIARLRQSPAPVRPATPDPASADRPPPLRVAPASEQVAQRKETTSCGD